MDEDSRAWLASHEARLRPGRELALTLVGLPLDEARHRCLEHGYIAEVGTTILNLRYDRIRLVVGQGVVTRADAG